MKTKYMLPLILILSVLCHASAADVTALPATVAPSLPITPSMGITDSEQMQLAAFAKEQMAIDQADAAKIQELNSQGQELWEKASKVFAQSRELQAQVGKRRDALLAAHPEIKAIQLKQAKAMGQAMPSK